MARGLNGCVLSPLTPYAVRFTSYAQSFARAMEMFCAMAIRTRWTTSRNP
jgi:hypothetical protein